jgi:UDPglucose 6-dehydrogenase
MLATKISFMNDIANLCEKLGADISNVRQGIGSDSRIGYSFIFPGAGYGGSCFPKDVQALVKTASENGHDLEILKAVEAVNYRQKKVLFGKVEKKFGSDLKGKTFAIWGLSFKPNTDDMREAPSIVLIDQLLEAGAKVRAYDPEAMEEAKHIFGDKIEFGKKSYEVLPDADALIIVTEWNEFRRPNLDKVKEMLAEPVIIDGRNIFEPEKMRDRGFYYDSIGRK